MFADDPGQDLRSSKHVGVRGCGERLFVPGSRMYAVVRDDTITNPLSLDSRLDASMRARDRIGPSAAGDEMDLSLDEGGA